MSEMLSRAFEMDMEVRADATGRTIHGIVVPYGQVARVSDGGPSYSEMFAPGAFKRSISMQPHNKVKLLSQHNSRSNPLGRATMLREDANGLYGEFIVSRTAAGDEALELVRDGALDSFSVGFTPIKHRKEDGVVVRTEAGIRESSLVTFPAYAGASVGGVRWADLADDEREEFLRMVGEHFNLRPTTPLSDPEAIRDTSDEPVPATDPAIDGHSVRHTAKFKFAAGLRERGL